MYRVLPLLLLAGMRLYSQTFMAGGGQILDLQTVDFPLSVSGLTPANIDSLNFGLETVCINLTHTWDADLEIELVSPDGTSFSLSAGNGGSGDNYTNTCFNHFAGTPISMGSPPFTGTFKPDGAMGMVNNGQIGNGIWKLRITDTYAGDEGTLLGWGITFGNNPATYTPPIVSSNLPIIVINTNNQVIPDEPKIIADMGVIFNGVGNRNYLTDPFNHYNGKIAIEVRGSSSQMFPKKSYGFETVNVSGIEIDTGFFGFPKESDWILSANYSDKSLLNNTLAYALHESMSGQWAPRTQHVELIINGDYKGVYVFMEKIKRDNKRVDIAKLNSWENAGDSLTGGYIIKIDKFTGNQTQNWTSPYPPAQSSNGQVIRFLYEYPSGDTITPQQMTYIQQYVDSFEDALAGPQFANSLTGYKRYADMYSFVNYFLVNEVSKNVDGYRISTYFYKDKFSKGGKITMGPVWDYDIAWGNANYCGGNGTTGWAYQFGNVCPGDGWQIPRWWQRMLQDTVYANAVQCQWSYWRTRMLDSVKLMTYIDSMALYLDESQQRNFARWPILGNYVWPNPSPIPATYQGEIDELKNWLWNRIVWLDANMPGTCYSLGEFEQELADSHFTLYPNPASGSIFLRFLNLGNSSVTIELLDISGKRISGFKYSGSDPEPLLEWGLPEEISAGIYLVKVSGDSFSLTKKLVIR
ncbi:MAG: CotH kinase family protein [Bacteroidia bacterium]|nr:CotH kinase family protein [Bacteroidia bacterium]